MSRYAVEVKESLKKTIVVEAENIDVALQKVESAYARGNIILDADDYNGTDIEPSSYFGEGSGEVSDDEDMSECEQLEDIVG